ncbi:MAG TPA: hypothetical protein VF755_23075 [Catenuloplanes sp.]|jgi:hypothetical protein
MAFLPWPDLTLPRPTAALALTRSLVGQAIESVAAVATVPLRVFRVLGATELLVTRLTILLDRAEDLLDRTTAVVDDADEAMLQLRALSAAATLAVEEATRTAAGAAAVIAEAELVTESAAGVITRTAVTAGTADELLASFEPTLRRAAPMAERFIQQLSPEEVTAAIRLIDELPRLREHLVMNVMPILGTLDKVGPDIHDLLEVTRDLKLAVAGIPGLKMLRRRGEDRLADAEEDERR